MPHRSRKISNVAIAIGGTFAFLLIMAGLLVISQKKSAQNFRSWIKSSVSRSEVASGGISTDISSWKVYRDPVYNFTIKYPTEWIDPVAKKISDPDFAYEYEVSFGTKEALQGSGIEGFNIFVFQTEKCTTGGGSEIGNTPQCSTHLTKVPSDAAPFATLSEFSSKTYTYTVVPILPGDGIAAEEKKSAAAEFNEAVKTFSFDPNVKLIPIAPKVQPTKQPSAKPQPAASARVGKLTGAVPAGGKMVCPHPGSKPRRSPNKGNHVDEDCCPDPDEWPNTACAYKPADYKIMLKPK